jgi:hypothetical protein
VLLLLWREFRRAAHALPARLRLAAAFRRAGVDQVASHVRQSPEHGDHQPPGVGGGVGPGLGQGVELRPGVHDLLDDGKQVEGRARQSVDPRHCHHVAGGEGFQHPQRIAPGGLRAAGLLPLNPGTPARPDCSS